MNTLQPLVEPALHLGERVGERLAGPALALRERRAPLVGEAAFLRRELRDRVRSLAGERPPDLLGVRGGLLLDGSADLGPGLGDELVGRRRLARSRARSASQSQRRRRARRPRGRRRESRSITTETLEAEAHERGRQRGSSTP